MAYSVGRDSTKVVDTELFVQHANIHHEYPMHCTLLDRDLFFLVEYRHKISNITNCRTSSDFLLMHLTFNGTESGIELLRTATGQFTHQGIILRQAVACQSSSKSFHSFHASGSVCRAGFTSKAYTSLSSSSSAYTIQHTSYNGPSFLYNFALKLNSHFQDVY